MLESFKQFLQTRPPIANLVFEQELPKPFMTAPTNAADYDLHNRPKYRRYFQARVQPDALIFREIDGPNGATNPIVVGAFVLIASNRFWFAYQGKGDMTTWEYRAKVAGREAYGPSASVTNALIPLWEQLLCGIQHVEPEKLMLAGSHVLGISGFEPCTVNGEIVAGPSGPPAAVKLKYTSRASSADWVTRYDSSDLLPETSYVPKISRVCWVDGTGQEVEVQRLTIISLTVGFLPATAPEFDPQSYIRANGWRTRVFTNGSYYALTPWGDLKFLYAVRSARSITGAVRKKPSALAVAASYGSFGMLNLGFFVLAVRMKNKAKQTKTEIMERSKECLCQPNLNPD